MISAITSLYRYGLRIAKTPYETYQAPYLLEIGGDMPILSKSEGSVEVPKSVDRSSNAETTPNHGYDTAKYVLKLGLKPKKPTKTQKQSFWSLVQNDFTQAGELEIVNHLQRMAQVISGTTAKLSGKGKYEVFDCEIPEGAIVVLTLNQKPITDSLKFRSMWEQCKSKEQPTHTDVITGDPCIPVRLHSKVKAIPGTGSKTPMISFQFETYGYQGRLNGLNFPVSSETDRAYTSAFDYLTDIEYRAKFDGGECHTAYFWPEETTEHGIIPLVCQLMGTRKNAVEAKALWEALEAWPADDEVNISILVLRGAKGRMSMLNYEVVTASALRKSMLRFHTDFKGLRSNVTFPSVAVFKRHEKEKSSVFDGLTMPQIAFAVLTGRPYPATLMSDLRTFPTDLSALVAHIPAKQRQRQFDQILGTIVYWERAYHSRLVFKGSQ